MQYIPSGAARTLEITNQSARGISNTLDEIARRGRMKRQQQFEMGRILGDDELMAEGARTKPRTFLDTLGNEYTGKYDDVATAIHNTFAKAAEGKTYLEKLRLARAKNVIMKDVNTVYARPQGSLREDLYGLGGVRGGRSKVTPRTLHLRGENGEETTATVYVPYGTNPGDPGYDRAVEQVTRKTGARDKTKYTLLSDKTTSAGEEGEPLDPRIQKEKDILQIARGNYYQGKINEADTPEEKKEYIREALNKGLNVKRQRVLGGYDYIVTPGTGEYGEAESSFFGGLMTKFGDQPAPVRLGKKKSSNKSTEDSLVSDY